MSSKFDYFVIFAEMRTGSNFLESNLSLFSGLQCYGEAFNPYFMVDPNTKELFGVTVAMRDADPMLLIGKMKENTPGIPGFRFFSDHDPRVFEAIIKDPRCAKVVLTRNQVESFVSRRIAWATDQWRLGDLKNVRAAKITFDPGEFEKLFNRMKAFQIRIVQELQKTGQTAFYIDYEDIRNLDAVNGLARFLGETQRIEAFSTEFKKQNPEPLTDKVKNFDEMVTALARIDHYDLGRLPNFEPRRSPLVPNYVTCPDTPLLFMPVQSGPSARVRGWMAALDDVDSEDLPGGFTQNALRQWKRQNKGHRSFTVLRHPVARLHDAFCRHFLSDGPETYGDIRRALRKTYDVPIPETADDPGYDRRSHRAAFLKFAAFVKGNLGGQTSIRVDGSWASQSMVLQGFSQFMLPDHILREGQLEEGLANLAHEVGQQPPALPPSVEDKPFTLADIYDKEIEAAVRSIYQRDYMMFGFGPWK